MLSYINVLEFRNFHARERDLKDYAIRLSECKYRYGLSVALGKTFSLILLANCVAVDRTLLINFPFVP